MVFPLFLKAVLPLLKLAGHHQAIEPWKFHSVNIKLFVFIFIPVGPLMAHSGIIPLAMEIVIGDTII